MSRNQMWVDGVCVFDEEVEDDPAFEVAGLTSAAETAAAALRSASTAILESSSSLSETGATRRAFQATADGLASLASCFDQMGDA